ncbi:hypothetical protein LTR05_003405 [Lithohypha guttulata]|uniref:Uncharacterized protein n=1 Tax=Lithohypha guttulata TaxID=1690604 RepID=A0AAN7T4A0_9EURO|nr:hypothetical protein LTR05_003405 [Lithohypha guttulata]
MYNHIKAQEDPGMHSHEADSWIDLSSQPSSSSLATNHDRDEIITTGLQIRRDNARRSRQLRITGPSAANQPAARSTSVAGSSQDEYTESESDSDKVLSSSNEDVSNTSNAGEEEEEEDDTRTALGVTHVERNIFTPQPHAFSHPPHGRTGPISSSQPVDSYFPPQQPPPSSSHRLPSNRVPTIQRPSQQRVSSNISPDHDAALRASLTTLLSCANAVRKDRDHDHQQTTRRSNQPTTLRLVPESEMDNENRVVPPASPRVSPKRKSRESSKERQAKKVRAVTKQTPTPEEMLVSPTMMTWFISAGVVLVFSAISFSAGYAWGKEVGHREAQVGLEGMSCGREAIRGSRTGLSKLRLTTAGA